MRIGQLVFYTMTSPADAHMEVTAGIKDSGAESVRRIKIIDLQRLTLQRFSQRIQSI